MYTILLVDDEMFFLNSIERVLNQAGYKTIKALNAEEALFILTIEEVDIILSDDLMPGIKGASFVKIANKLYPQIVSLILTGNPYMESIYTAVNEGNAFKYLTKPISNSELINHIRLASEYREALIKQGLQTNNSLNISVADVDYKIVSSEEFISSISEYQLMFIDKFIEQTSLLFAEISSLDIGSSTGSFSNIRRLMAEIADSLSMFDVFAPVIEELGKIYNLISTNADLKEFSKDDFIELLYLLEEEFHQWAVDVFINQNVSDINSITQVSHLDIMQ